MPLLSSVIAVAALPHLQATHFKNEQLKKQSVHARGSASLHSFFPFYFIFFAAFNVYRVSLEITRLHLKCQRFLRTDSRLLFLCVEHSQSSVALMLVVKKSVSIMETSSDSLHLKVLL